MNEPKLPAMDKETKIKTKTKDTYIVALKVGPII